MKRKISKADKILQKVCNKIYNEVDRLSVLIEDQMKLQDRLYSGINKRNLKMLLRRKILSERDYNFLLKEI